MAAKEMAVRGLDRLLDPLTRALMRKNHIYREIAADIYVNAEWAQFVLDLPKRPRNKRQEISLYLTDCRLSVANGQLLFLDDTVIDPENDIEVEVSDAEGKTSRLQSGRFGVNDHDAASDTCEVHTAGFGLPSAAGPYTLLKIRSERPFRCRRVVWHNFDLK